MKIEALDRYKRRRSTCHFTFRLALDAPRLNADGESYDESFHWAYLKRVGEAWVEVERHSHGNYPPPVEPTFHEIVSALAGSAAERRALSAMAKVGG